MVVAAAGIPGAEFVASGHGNHAFGMVNIVSVATILFEIHVVFHFRIIEVFVAHQTELVAAVVRRSDFTYLDAFKEADSFLSHFAIRLGTELVLAIAITRRGHSRQLSAHLFSFCM